MSEKAALRIAPLQRVVAEEITDPAEIAAIDKMRKRAKRRQSRPTNQNGAQTESGRAARATRRRK